jgi:cysteine synthase
VRARRAKVIEKQDALVEAASAEVEAAIAGVAATMGVEVAAEVLGLTKAEVRRIAKDNR